VIIRGRQARSGTHRTINIGYFTAFAADDVVVVVIYPSLISSNGALRLNSADDAAITECVERVIHRLLGHRAKFALCAVHDLVGGGMGMGADCVHHRDALSGDVHPMRTEQGAYPVGLAGHGRRLGQNLDSVKILRVEDVQDFAIADLSEIGIERSDGTEKLGGEQADEVIHLGIQAGERFSRCHRNGEGDGTWLMRAGYRDGGFCCCPGGQTVIHNHCVAPGDGCHFAMGPEKQRPCPHLFRLRSGEALELLRRDSSGNEVTAMGNDHSTFAHGTYREFGTGGKTDLADE
jgi:hypothetical protein